MQKLVDLDCTTVRPAQAYHRMQERVGMKGFILSDSTLLTGQNPKGRKEDNKGMREAYEPLCSGMYDELVIWSKPGGECIDFVGKLKEWIRIYAPGGNPSEFRHDLTVVMSGNECLLKNGVKKHLDPESLRHANEFAEILRMLPSVTIIGPGSEACWKTPGFDNVANELMKIMASTGHLIYSGAPLYSKLSKRDGMHFGGQHETRQALAQGLYIMLELNHFLKTIGQFICSGVLESPPGATWSSQELATEAARPIKTEKVNNDIQQNDTGLVRAAEYAKKDCQTLHGMG
jgi:hypothetical protein